jgi:serine/threonine-protein kinase
MALEAGTKLGPYEILSPLGAGGMGEVYRARDSKLDREVAIKVLPELFSRDPERVQRFQREAKVLASLNHPNIAAIYGFEVADKKNFLVMELVEGDTLSERLKDGPMPVEEALSVGKQMCEAMEAAHERGVIHRDLKPANIIITPEGSVKVLDFGLAKAMGPADERSGTEIANSPTITADFTRPGTILGTAAYMSPEQARGKPLDKRTDIWSFGCVLYECLGGRRPFAGETATDLIAKILEREPDWDNLPADTPPVVTALIQRCFRKDRRERLRDIGEAWVVLNGALSGELSGLALTGYAVAPRTPLIRRAIPWALCGILMVAVMLLLSGVWRAAGPGATRPIRAIIEIGPDQLLQLHTGAQFALSPDGSLLAYVAGSSQDYKLYLRRMDQLQSTALSGTAGAKHPFFSPDGEWIAFFTNTHLKKISVSGGTPITLCAVDDDSRGGTWGIDGTIVLAPGTESGLLRIHSAGGEPEKLTTRVEGKVRSHRWPRFTPDGRHILFTSQDYTTDFDGSSIEV